MRTATGGLAASDRMMPPSIRARIAASSRRSTVHHHSPKGVRCSREIMAAILAGPRCPPAASPQDVMPGLVLGIHDPLRKPQAMDGRDKPGHDEFEFADRDVRLKSSPSIVDEKLRNCG